MHTAMAHAQLTTCTHLLSFVLDHASQTQRASFCPTFAPCLQGSSLSPRLKLVKILFYHCCFSYCNHDNGCWLLGTKTQAGPYEAG